MSAAAPAVAAPAPAPLAGAERMLGAVMLAAATFMVVLDITVANVSVATIAGDLGVSATQGTWIVTSYAAAQAIAMPLTGWLTRRFGQVRLIVASVLLFTAASWLCGLAESLETLVAFRVLQGLVAGPMVPVSQSLLLATFGPGGAGMALAVWSMTATIAPITGPIIGGYITEQIAWPWIFYINVPVGLLAGGMIWLLYRERETPRQRVPVDVVGLVLLTVWVAALQVMLDKGKELDWFASGEIVALACAAGLGFALFLVWELLDNPHPVVDLQLLRDRDFWTATATLSVGYAVFFGAIVVLPLWLQQTMGYTQIWAGLMMMPFGVLALVLAPVIARTLHLVDARLVASLGFLVFALVSFMRAGFDMTADWMTIALPMFIQGAGNVMFFLPLTALGLRGMSADKMPGATGLQNFLRYMGGAVGASLAVTLWDDRAKLHRAHLAEHLTRGDPATEGALRALEAQGLGGAQALAHLDRALEVEARMLSTVDLFWISGVLFLALAALVWLANPPRAAAKMHAATGSHE
ncbi:MAG TPA: DHA2 family efflux MFS transporter permease subunit [Burkholderiales bacterium]|nr:DHA2 family efflux MFS transporter permease subunit [Burkholderiales bacterium]